MNQPRVLLAVGNETVSQILRRHFDKSENFRLIDHEIMHFRFLKEIIDIEKPEIIVVHDVFLPSDREKKEEREQEWLSFFHSTRQKYDSLRIVFLCERDKEDIFLNQIVGLGVQDIFNESSIDMSAFITQLSHPPRYANVSKFRDIIKFSAPVNFEVEKADEQELDNDNKSESEEESSSNKPKEIIVEKEVIKEVIVEKPVEKLVMQQVDKQIILVVSPFERSGSTFVSHLLAKKIADMDISVSYIENPFRRSYAFDRFNGYIKTENYRSVFHSYIETDSEETYTHDWKIDGVNMNVKHPDERIYTEKEVSFESFIKILLNTNTTVTIIDIGQDWNKEVFLDIFDIASHVLMVMEPDISDIHYLDDPNNIETQSYQAYLSKDKAFLVGNRLNDAMKKNKLIQEHYADKMSVMIPNVDADVVFDCQEQAIFLNSHSSNLTQSLLKEPLSQLVDRIIPDNMLKRKRKKKLFTLFK